MPGRRVFGRMFHARYDSIITSLCLVRWENSWDKNVKPSDFAAVAELVDAQR